MHADVQNERILRPINTEHLRLRLCLRIPLYSSKICKDFPSNSVGIRIMGWF